MEKSSKNYILDMSALKKKLPLITDETKLVHHTRDKIEVYFSPLFLIMLLQAGYLLKEKALKNLEKMRDIRNWGSNIIYLTFKSQLEKFN